MPSKATWAIVIVAPIVLLGISLVGFQTYSWITGKDFKDLNFDIGLLWPSTDENESPEVLDRLTVDFYPYRPEILSHDEDESTLITNRKNEVKSLPSKAVSVLPKTDGSHYFLHSEVPDVINHAPIGLQHISENYLVRHYYERLEQSELIKPNLIPDQSKWYVSMFFSPLLSYRNFSFSSNQPVVGTHVVGNTRYTYGLTKNARNQNDRLLTTYSLGVNGGRKFLRKWTVSLGLQYAVMGETLLVSAVDESNPQYHISSYDNKKPAYGLFEDNNSEDQQLDDVLPYSNRYSYVELPVNFEYDLIQNIQSRVAVQAGITVGKLYKVNALVYDFETGYYYWMNEPSEVYKRIQTTSEVGLIYSQFIDQKLELFLNPSFRYNLNSTFIKDYPIRQNQFATGIRIGVKKHL